MPDSKPNILLVDDEDALREVVAERLRDEGFEVSEAASGEGMAPAVAQFMNVGGDS